MKNVLARIVPLTLLGVLVAACNAPVDEREERGEDVGDVSQGALTLSGGSVVTLENACGRKALDIDAFGTGDGAPAITWSSHGGANQQFTLQAATGNTFSLLARHSGKALDVVGASMASGAGVQQWSAHGGANQRWIFTTNSDGTYRISPGHAPGLSLATRSNSGADGVAVEVESASTSCTQRWTVLLLSTATPTPTPAPSGTGVPVGDLPGWKQTLAEDFTTAATAGAKFASTYAGAWCGYADNSQYKQGNVSASGGNMVVTLTGSSGAAGVFAPGGCKAAWNGTVYGRYSMRFKAVGAAGNGSATMVWPTSDTWGDGEIDYPEGNFDGNIHAYHHGVGCTDCSASDGADTGASFQEWHIATTEWSPGKVVYAIDGKVFKTVTHDVPTTPHRFTMQAAPVSASAKTGQFLIDWVAIYTRN